MIGGYSGDAGQIIATQILPTVNRILRSRGKLSGFKNYKNVCPANISAQANKYNSKCA